MPVSYWHRFPLLDRLTAGLVSSPWSIALWNKSVVGRSRIPQYEIARFHARLDPFVSHLCDQLHSRKLEPNTIRAFTTRFCSTHLRTFGGILACGMCSLAAIETTILWTIEEGNNQIWRTLRPAHSRRVSSLVGQWCFRPLLRAIWLLKVHVIEALQEIGSIVKLPK